LKKKYLRVLIKIKISILKLMENNWLDPKTSLILIVFVIFGSLGGYLYFANKKMYDAGIHTALNKK
jgi:hypothetical protein